MFRMKPFYRSLLAGLCLIPATLAAAAPSADRSATTVGPPVEQRVAELFESGGHPRLWFARQDLPTLRDRLDREPYDAIADAVRGRLEDPEGFSTILYDHRVRNTATLYAMTGERRYADQCAALVERVIADDEFWNDPESKGLTRAAGALSVAWAYDLCHDAWAPAFRQRVSKELLRAARGVMKSMGAYANNNIANNWQGVRYGAAGLAALACDEPGRRGLAKEAYDGLLRHLRANLGNSVWNPEGIGYTNYPWTFTGPFGIAAYRAGLGDLREDMAATRHTLWTTLVGTVPIPHTSGHGLRADLSDDHPAYTGHGNAALAFWYTTPQRRPALRWVFDTLVGGEGDQTWDSTWGGGLYAWLLYPAGLDALNPAEVEGLGFVDEGHGVAVFRDAFADENDIVAVVNAAERRPKGAHAGPDTNTIRLLGLGGAFIVGGGRTSNPAGQTNLFAGEPPERHDGKEGRLVNADLAEDGSGVAVVEGSCLGVLDHRRTFIADFGETSGAAAMFVNAETSRNGRLWRLNTPEFNEITTDGRGFTITAPHGPSLRVTVLEPAEPQFRTGKVERGGGAGHTAFPYRGTKYIHNKWIDFPVDGNAVVAMTLQRGDPPAVKLDRGLHGVEAKIGDATVVWDADERAVLVGDDARTADVLDRDRPLRPTEPRAKVVADDAVALAWDRRDLGAASLVVERQPAEPADANWTTVARLEPEATAHRDRGLEPDTTYRYRLVAEAENGQRSSPAPAGAVTTWQRGYTEHVEDFAPADAEAPNRLGDWTIVDAPSPNFYRSEKEGSPRGAGVLPGQLSIGFVPIRENRAFYTDDLACDLSGGSAEISFDIRCRETTVFSPMLKLADGRWVIFGRAYVKSWHDWQTLRFGLTTEGDDARWWAVDPDKRTRGGEVQVTASDLADVRGVGVFVEWVINKKDAAIDQFHLRAKGLRQQ